MLDPALNIDEVLDTFLEVVTVVLSVQSEQDVQVLLLAVIRSFDLELLDVLELFGMKLLKSRNDRHMSEAIRLIFKLCLSSTLKSFSESFLLGYPKVILKRRSQHSATCALSIVMNIVSPALETDPVSGLTLFAIRVELSVVIWAVFK